MKDLMNLFIAGFKVSFSNIIWILILSSFFIGSLVVVNLLTEIPIGQLTRDPIVVLFGPLYTGYFSQLGCLLWAVSVGICFFSVNILQELKASTNIINFLNYSGWMSLLLCIDDTFLLHDEVLPYMGVHENIYYLGYLGMVIYFLLKYYPTIFKTQFILIGIAFFSFGISMSIDKLPIPFIRALPVIYEDGAKMIGIVSWVFYFFIVSKNTIFENNKKVIITKKLIYSPVEIEK